MGPEGRAAAATWPHDDVIDARVEGVCASFSGRRRCCEGGEIGRCLGTRYVGIFLDVLFITGGIVNVCNDKRRNSSVRTCLNLVLLATSSSYS
jgi:hypothetical protein